jgi:Calcineurin-like phosphoesterase
MAKKQNVPATKKGARTRRSKQDPLRFAHPYFTKTPPETRPEIPGHGKRMLDYIQGTLRAVPPTKGNGQMTLSDVIGQAGADAVAATNQITIHIAGDTGVPETDHETNQVIVTDEMAKDYAPAKPGLCPAFFLHLGDVIYGSSPDAYLSQFYRPYMHYPGKIVAIPGNHDGDLDTKFADFQKYFCAPSQSIPPIAGSIFRQTMNQPGVYWWLDAPFVQIIGLYSNSAENPGFISGNKPGPQQKKWLITTLKSIKAARDKGARKALFFATHHPPYSSGGHSGSALMLQDIDDACKQAGIMPDAFFSGHAHSIQRYTRTVQLNGKKFSIPYIVSGCAGHGGQPLATAGTAASGDVKYEFGYEGWGYTTAQITAKTVTITSYGVDPKGTGKKKVDSVTWNLS